MSLTNALGEKVVYYGDLIILVTTVAVWTTLTNEFNYVHPLLKVDEHLTAHHACSAPISMVGAIHRSLRTWYFNSSHKESAQ